MARTAAPGKVQPIAAEQLVIRRERSTDPIGIQLRSKGGKEVVVAVEAGSAAERAGVQVGDVLLAVGKHAALSIEQVSRLLKPDRSRTTSQSAQEEEEGSGGGGVVDSLLVGRPRRGQVDLLSSSSASTTTAAAPLGYSSTPTTPSSKQAAAGGTGLPARQQQAEAMFTQVAQRCTDGVAESRAALQMAQQRARAERAIAESYANLDEGVVLAANISGGGGGGGGGGEAMASSSSSDILMPVFSNSTRLGKLHAKFAEVLREEVEGPLANNLKLTEVTLKGCIDLAHAMGRELKQSHGSLSRARTELHKRHLEAEGLNAEYHKLTRESTDAKKAAAADKLAKLCQKLAVAKAKVEQAEEVYRRERATSLISTWKHCTLEIPAVCIQMKGVEASRSELLASTQWRALDQLSELPNASTNDMEERLRLAAEIKGRRWLDAAL